MAECGGPRPASSFDRGGGIACDAALQQIVRMIVQQYAPAEILEALCRLIGDDEKSQPIAFFLMDGDRWTIVAKSRLVPQAEAALTRIDAAQLSQALFQAGASAAARPVRPFEAGWARHLCSGVGELLGIVVGLAEGPLLPCGAQATRIESACHLATLAIEQRNLLAELAFKNDCDAVARLSRHGEYGELSMQRVAEMIARQDEPREILAALCQHAGEAREEQQVAFFLTDGEQWTLAAKGDLTVEAEAALAAIEPARLSEALFQPGACTANHAEFPFEHGWARHLYSGTGELLGMLVGLADGPVLPSGPLAVRVESICRLATLALEQRNLVQELAFKAEHDSLTGLYNRAYYERVLGRALQDWRRTGRRPALLDIDVDRFRLVNDVLGHAMGDRLLDRIGRRFQSGLRAEDVLARVGGDEFAVLVAEAPAIEDAGAVAGRLLRSLAEPFSVDGHELFVGASIGIAGAAPESTPESLARQAHLALCQAKQAGTGRLMYFHSAMAATPPERLEMERRLRFALARKEILVYYQPQVDVFTGHVTGAEALLRWRPEGLGIVSPAAFVPILEETGLIADFGRWVLGEACRQGREWIDRTGLRVRIGVNVSASQLALPGFLQDVQQPLLETGFPPELLELELTESAFVGDFAAASRIFRNLRNSAGISFAVDDFGTGQSSLAYLQQLPFQRLKIDQSFIRRIGCGQEPEPLVESILRMAEDLGMRAIAEGVETPHQLKLLQRLRCPEAQGFLFAPPLPPRDFVEFCAKNSSGALLSRDGDRPAPLAKPDVPVAGGEGDLCPAAAGPAQDNVTDHTPIRS